MASYLYTLLSFTLVLSVFSHLSFNDKTKRLIALSGSVLFFSLAVAPLGELVESITEFDIDNYLEDLNESFSQDGEYLKKTEEGYCNGIKRLVCEEFSLEYSDLEVSAENFDFETMSATRVKILLKNRAVYADNRAISEYVFRNVGVWCSVEVLFK